MYILRPEHSSNPTSLINTKLYLSYRVVLERKEDSCNCSLELYVVSSDP